jgi:hypothetical protein
MFIDEITCALFDNRSIAININNSLMEIKNEFRAYDFYIRKFGS